MAVSATVLERLTAIETDYLNIKERIGSVEDKLDKLFTLVSSYQRKEMSNEINAQISDKKVIELIDKIDKFIETSTKNSEQILSLQSTLANHIEDNIKEKKEQERKKEEEKAETDKKISRRIAITSIIVGGTTALVVAGASFLGAWLTR